jgi:hypothetical protein
MPPEWAKTWKINNLETFVNGQSGPFLYPEGQALLLAAESPTDPPDAVVNKRGFVSRIRFLSGLFPLRTDG